MKGIVPPKKAMKAQSVKDTFKKDSDDTTMLSLRIRTDLHRRMKIRAAAEGRTMTDILEGLMAEYLAVGEYD